MGSRSTVIPTMASFKMNTKDFFGKGTPNQYEFTLNKYDQALRLKAEAKSSKPENVIKLDKWYQNDLPKKIKSRGKDAHMVHDELVQTIKWKLARGKFFPQLTNLVRINTPKAVQTETRKAFRKLPNVEQAISTLTNLKGVGTTLASAVLAAGRPDVAPFMADECIMSMPEYDGLDYTMKEYMRYVEYVKSCVERLNSQSPADPKYTPHIVELAVWTHYILYDLKPELLEDMPTSKVEAAPAATAAAPTETEEVPSETATSNGAVIADEDTKSSMASSMDEDSNSEAKNHNINPVGFAELEAIAETPSAAVTTESEAPEEAPAAEKIEIAEVTAVENGNNGTPKTNGNNSHSNGSAATPEKPSVAPIAKEISANGAAAVVATDDNEKIEAKVSEQNGVKSSEKESTDLRSPSPSAKRSLDEAEQPVEKKLKTCEENAAEVGAASEAATQAAPTSTPQVAV